MPCARPTYHQFAGVLGFSIAQDDDVRMAICLSSRHSFPERCAKPPFPCLSPNDHLSADFSSVWISW